jgi:hypothetical protein
VDAAARQPAAAMLVWWPFGEKRSRKVTRRGTVVLGKIKGAAERARARFRSLKPVHRIAATLVREINVRLPQRYSARKMPPNEVKVHAGVE